MNKINLCITTDISYLKYTASFIASLIEHINTNYFYDLYILTDKKISQLEKDKLLYCKHPNLKIICKSFDNSIFQWYEGIRIKFDGSIWSYAYYYRWFINRYVDVDKIIYFDTDMVINWDVSELFNIDLWEKTIWAAKDIFFTNNQLYQKYWVKVWFNSWMLLINLKKWRDKKIWEKCLEFKKENAKYSTFFDQDTLNVVLKDDWLCVSPKFNWMATERPSYTYTQYTKKEYEESLIPAVIHYTWFLQRPWKWIVCVHPYCFLYFMYLKKTKYRDKEDSIMLFNRYFTSNIVCRSFLKMCIIFWFALRKQFNLKDYSNKYGNFIN